MIAAARGLAAFGVYTYHYHVGDILARYAHFPAAGYLDVFGGVYAVPLFFLISGYCIHGSEWRRSKQGERRFDWIGRGKRRFLRIYPAYIVAPSFSLAIGSASGEHY